GFSISGGLFWYAWLGGLPGDLIGTARACVEFRRLLGRPTTVREFAEPVIRQDVKAAVDALLTAALETGSKMGIESLLGLRRKLEDASVLLDGLLEDFNFDDEFEVTNSDGHPALMPERLKLYIELGRSIVSYF